MSARTARVRDMALQERILHYIRPKQEKQRDAYNEACARLRPEERPVFRAHVEVPTPKQVGAQTQAELDQEIDNLVERGTLVFRPYGIKICYGLAE